MFFAKYASGRTDNFNSDKEQRYLYNNLVNKQLDSWHPRCAQVARDHLPTKTYENVVDIGCCGGSTLEFLGVSGEKVTLIDIAERQLEVAKEKARNTGAVGQRLRPHSDRHADLCRGLRCGQSRAEGDAATRGLGKSYATTRRTGPRWNNWPRQVSRR